jgi:hypothetical protein
LPVSFGQDYDELKSLLTSTQARSEAGAKARKWAETAGHVDTSIEQWKGLLRN